MKASDLEIREYRFVPPDWAGDGRPWRPMIIGMRLVENELINRVENGLFDRPDDVFVASQVGSPKMNLFEGVSSGDGGRVRLPFGEVETFHVRPRREVTKGSDMVAQMWFAPSLQYLPVRIRIRQDAETSVDLLLERLPQQAATPTR